MKNIIENDLYYIEQLNDECLGKNILVIVKTYEGIDDIDNLALILKESKFETTYNDVIIDLTVANGITASNRYIKIGYRNGYLKLQDNSSVSTNEYKEEFIKMLKSNCCEYLRKNDEVLENSVIHNAHKFIIKSGEVI